MRSEKGAGLKSQKGLPDPRPWTIVDEQLQTGTKLETADTAKGWPKGG